MKLLLATRNRKKLRELQILMRGLPVELLTLDAFPDAPDVEEDGATFEANALKKARSAFQATGIPVMADDSGLEVDALDGRPGVFSARYAGNHGDDRANYEKLLRELGDTDEANRTARFRCVIALIEKGPDGDPVEAIFDASCNGSIARVPKGDGGFGYDPVFYVEDKGKTMAELSDDEKNLISHRGLALNKVRAYLQKRFR